MVIIAIIIAVLVAAGIWLRLDFKLRYWKERCELFQELYENEVEWRVDSDIKLADARDMISRQIAANAQQWAENEASRAVH